MGLIEEKVAELEARLAELEPVLREAEVLRESIASLRAILDRDEVVVANPPYGATKRPYFSIEARKEQISQVLAEEPDATNAKIGERLGISAARVGQIRQQM